MPGKTPQEADEAFLAPLRRAISCLTTAQLYVSKPGDPRVLALSEDPLRLRSSIVSGDLMLSLRQQFRSVKDPKAPAAQRWHVSTVRYDYRLSRADDGSELVPGTGTPELASSSRTCTPPCRLTSADVSTRPAAG